MENITELFLVQTRFRIKEEIEKLDMSGYGVALPMLAAYERSKEIVTKIYDPILNMDTYKNVLDKIKNVNPLVLGISRITTSYMEDVLEFISDIRNIGYTGFIFLGGHAPSLEYEMILERCNGLDCVVIGEGEETIYELVNAVRTRQEWKNIDGIAYIEDEKVKTTRMRPLIQDLDELPFMAR